MITQQMMSKILVEVAASAKYVITGQVLVSLVVDQKKKKGPSVQDFNYDFRKTSRIRKGKKKKHLYKDLCWGLVAITPLATSNT